MAWASAAGTNSTLRLSTVLPSVYSTHQGAPVWLRTTPEPEQGWLAFPQKRGLRLQEARSSSQGPCGLKCGPDLGPGLSSCVPWIKSGFSWCPPSWSQNCCFLLEPRAEDLPPPAPHGRGGLLCWTCRVPPLPAAFPSQAVHMALPRSCPYSSDMP